MARQRRAPEGRKVLTLADLRCPETGKTAYITEERAMRVVEKAYRTSGWKNNHGGMPKRAYQCPICGWWHLTQNDSRPHSGRGLSSTVK